MWRIERNRNKISNVVDNAKIWTNLSHPFRDYLIQISPPPPQKHAMLNMRWTLKCTNCAKRMTRPGECL